MKKIDTFKEFKVINSSLLQFSHKRMSVVICANDHDAFQLYCTSERNVK
jgi:hypothetical protein